MHRQLLYICFFILISHAAAGTFWFNIPNPPAVDPSKPLSNLKDFANGFFEYFGLQHPSQIVDCFSRDSATLFFEQLQESYDMVTYANKKYAIAIRSDFFKQPLFVSLDPHVAACVAFTQDLSNLFQKLDITLRDPKVFSESNLLYYQAHYNQLLEDFNPVIGYVNDEQFSQAGGAFARLIEQLVLSVKNEGLNYLAFQGFVNGMAISLGLEDLSFPSVLENDMAEQILWMVQNLEVLLFVQNWDDEFSKAHQEKQEKFEWSQSPGAKKLNERLGVNVLSSEFYRKFGRYAERHQVNFENQMKLIRDYIGNRHTILAGEIFGKWINAAAASDE